MLYKTQLCSFYAKGICARGNKCNWAHGQMDVRPMPKFYKTRMCYTFLSGSYCEASKCTFAHTEEELRGSGKALRLCTKFVLDGYCNKGDRCPMAHSINQLDPSVKFSAAELMNRVCNDENNGYKNKNGKHIHNSHTIYSNNNYHIGNYHNNNNIKNTHNHASENKEERFPINHHPENEKNLKSSKKNRVHYYTHHEKKTCPDCPMEQFQGNNKQYCDMKKKKENENVMGSHVHAQGHANTQELPVNEYVKNRKGKIDHRKHHEIFKNEYHKEMECGKNGDVLKMNENTQNAEYTTYTAAADDDEMNINMTNIGGNKNCKMYNYKNEENCDICKCDEKTSFCYNNKPHTLDEFYQRPINISEQNMYGISGINLGNISNINSMQNVSTVGDIRTICNIEDAGTNENVSNVNNIDSVNTLTIVGNMGNVVHSCSMDSRSMNTCVSNSMCMNDSRTTQNNQHHLQYNGDAYTNGSFEKRKSIKKMEKNNISTSGKANSSGYNYQHVKKLGKNAANCNDIEKNYILNSLKKENMENVAFDSNTTYAYSKTNSNFYSGTCNEDIHTNYKNDSNNTIADSNNNVPVDMAMSNLFDDDTHEMEDNEYENSQLSINFSKNAAARSNNNTMKNVPVNNRLYSVNNMNQVNREMSGEMNTENKNNDVEGKYKYMKRGEGKKNKMQHADKKEAEDVIEVEVEEEREGEVEEEGEVEAEGEKKEEKEKEEKEEKEEEEEEEEGKKGNKENKMEIIHEMINYNENVHMGYPDSIYYPMKSQYSVQSAKAKSHNNNNNNYHMEKYFSEMNEKMLIYNPNCEYVGTNDQCVNGYAMTGGYMGPFNQMQQFHVKNAFHKTTNAYNEVHQFTPMMDVEVGIPTGMGGITGIQLVMNKPNGNQYNNENIADAHLIQNMQHMSVRDVQTINSMQNMNSAEIHERHFNNVNSGILNGTEHFVAEMNKLNAHRVGNVGTTNREENREVKVKAGGRRARRRGRGGNEKERVEKEQVHVGVQEAEIEAEVEQDVKGNVKMEKHKTQKDGQGQGQGQGQAQRKGKGRGRGKGKEEAESKQNMENTKRQEHEEHGEDDGDKKGGGEEEEADGVEEECRDEDGMVDREKQKENQKTDSDRMQHKLDMNVNKTVMLENENNINEDRVTNHDHTRDEQNKVGQRIEHAKEKEAEGKEEEVEEEEEEEEENESLKNETLNKKNKGNVYHTMNNSMDKLKNPIHNNFLNKNTGDKLNVYGLNRRNINFTHTIDGMSAEHKNHKMHLDNFEHMHVDMKHTPSETNINMLNNCFNAQRRECYETRLTSSEDIINDNSHMDRNINIHKENNHFFFNNYNTNNYIRNMLDNEKYEHGPSSSFLNESIIINENRTPNNMQDIMSIMSPMGNVYANNFRDHVYQRNSHIENIQVVANMRLRCNINSSDDVNRYGKVYKNLNINNMDRGNNELRIQTHAQLHGRINTHMSKEMMTQINEQRNTTMEGVTEIDIGMKMGVGMEMEMGMGIGMGMGMEMQMQREREILGGIGDGANEAQHNTGLCNNEKNYFFTDFEKNDITNFQKYNYPMSYLDASSLHFNANNNAEFYENINNYIFDKNDTSIIKSSEHDFFLGEESFMNIEEQKENEQQKQKQKKENEMLNSFNPLTYNFSGLCECLNKSSEDGNEQQ